FSMRNSFAKRMDERMMEKISSLWTHLYDGTAQNMQGLVNRKAIGLYTDYEKATKEKEERERKRKKEKNMQEAILDLRKKFGKNAVLKGMNLTEGGTTIERNGQIGGHKA
ncbi:MAG: DNA methylase, partial [Lachnospiraceae bacterium]|nr:DNA methylase [Lachnospiraceae bacterium]